MKTVTIIGSSVAGLSTALELLKLKSNINVVMVDKKKKIGVPTICGGGVSVCKLRQAKVDVPKEAIATNLTGVRIYSPDGNCWELKSDKAYGYVLWRAKYEQMLADEVIGRGGKIMLGRFVERLPANVLFYPWIGADGFMGVTRRTVMCMPNPGDVHHCVQLRCKMNVLKNIVSIYFGRKVAPQGYAWIFPETDEIARVGLGIPRSLKLNPALFLNKFVKKIQATPVEKMQSKLVPTAPPPKNLVFGNIVLVGDAALLCDALTGGGIANAMISGKLAAKSIIEEDLESYNKKLRSLRRELTFRYKMKKVIYELDDEDFDQMVDGMKDFHPNLTRIGFALSQGLINLAIRKPKLLTKHKILRRVVR